mgnify:CR=1 FL=1
MKNTNSLLGDSSEELSLDTLNDEQVSLDDVSTAPLNNIRTSDSSNKQLATNTALLNEDAVEASKAFTSMNTEMTIEGSRKEQERVVGEANKATLADTQEALVNVLLDDTVSSEGKEAAAKQALDHTSELFNVRKMVTTKQLSKPLKRETVEVERVRGNFSDQVDFVNDQLKSQQKLLNSRAAAVNSDTAKATVDFFEAMLPFSRSKIIGGIVSDLKENLGEGSGFESSRIKSFVALGSSFQDVQEMISSTPIEKRPELTQMLADIIDNNSEIVLPDGNDYAKVDLLRTFLEEGYYGDGSAWADTVVGILDLTIVGGPLVRLASKFGKAVKKAKNAPTLDEIVADIKTKRTFYGESKTSAGNNAEQANPDTARLIFDSAVNDDDVAKAFYGVPSVDVAVKGINPKPFTREVSVDAIPSQMGRNQDIELSGDPDIMDYIRADGKIYYTESEKRALRSKVFLDFEAANGLTLRENITQVGSDTSDGIGIKAVYSHSANSGWESAEDAIKQTTFALRKYGLTESDITIMVRSGDKYVPVKDLADDVPVVNDYIAQVRYNYDYNPLDVQEWAKADSTYNIFDKVFRSVGRIPLGQANLSRYMKDASSLFSPEMSRGALRAEDRSAAIEKRLVIVAKGFDDIYLKLPSKSQQKVHEYVKEANHRGLKFNETYLNGKGYNKQEVDSLREWKRYWDTAYTVENADMTTRLNAQGWELYRNADTNLVVRKVGRNVLGTERRFYNGATNSMVTKTDAELTDLYSSGGSIMEVKTPFNIEGKEVSRIFVPQSADNFTRRLRDEDHVLNYREGYYAVKYKEPWFLDKRVVDEKGDFLRFETVANAGSRVDAETLSKRLQAGDGFEYIVRGDRSSSRTIQDDYIEVSIAQGRSSQRFRGERLREASGTPDANEKFIVDPVEAMMTSARSLGNRVGYSQYLEASKQRWVSNHEAFLGRTNGTYRYPSSKKQIVSEDVKNKEELADAMAEWEYINYLENGYINGIDEAYKAGMRSMADALGEVAHSTPKLSGVLSKAERATRAVGTKAPIGLARNIAFQSYLAMNPLRQFVVQGNQAFQLVGLEPKFASLTLSRQVTGILQHKTGTPNVGAKAFGVSRKEMDEIVEAYDASGLTANVDRHSMVAGSMTQMADSWSTMGKGKRVASAAWNAPRKVGFDAGENINMMTAWLTFRHRAIKAGKDFSRTDVQAEVAALARDFTYAMNFAGDLPYNQNSMSLFMQFMQAPHKGILQITSNKNWTKAEKSRVAALSLIMYSLPPAITLGLLVPAIDEIASEDVKETVAFGLRAYMLNSLTSNITGVDTKIDYSSLSPLDMYGFYDVLTELWTSDIGEAIASTPAASLMIGHNPKITDAYRGAMRFFHLRDDGVEAPEDFAEVMEGVAAISSGYSNYMKFNMAQETSRKLSSTGRAHEVTKVESWFQLFGLPPQEETQARLYSNKVYDKSEDIKKDFDLWYGEMKRVLARKGVANEDTEFEEVMLNKFLMHFKASPDKFNEMLFSSLSRDAKNGDDRIYAAAKRSMGMMNEDELKDLISTAPMSEEGKAQIKDAMKMIQQFRDEEATLIDAQQDKQ